MNSPIRNELLVRYKDNIARLKALRAPYAHLVKVRQALTLRTLYKWYKEGKLRIAEWNREEVDNRIGTAGDWAESAATYVSAGIFLATWKGTPVLTQGHMQFSPTVENPIVIYEGGHRTRWTEAIFENEARCCGMTFSEIQFVLPEAAKDIETTIIEMTVATSENAAALESFAKRDYDRVNTYTEKLKPGEVIRTRSDATRTSLENKLVDAMKRKLKPKARDAHLEDQRALIHCAAGLVDKMDKKKGSLIHNASLTLEQVEHAKVVIAALLQAETQIDTLFSVKKVKTRIMNRQIDLALDGAIVWALQAAGAATRNDVVDDIVKFYRMFFETPETWRAVLAEIKTATVERSRYKDGETPYPARWTRIQNKIRPPTTVQMGSEIMVPFVDAV